MNTEEKAKAYDEALKRAKNLENTTTEENALIKYIFPELAENENESRIGNVIYCIVRDNKEVERILEGNGVSVDNALAYLEKQKKCLADNSKTSDGEDERVRKWLYEYIDAHNWRNDYTVSKEEALDYLEKQKEKKDYRKLYEDIAKSEWFKKNYVGKSLGENPYDFARGQQEEQKPTEWNEDERIRRQIIQYIKASIRHWKDDMYYSSWVDYLEKQKEQKPPSQNLRGMQFGTEIAII